MKQIFLVLVLFPILAFADTPRGEKFIARLWKDMKDRNIEKIDGYTSKHFQGACPYKVLSKKGMLRFLKGLKIRCYNLYDVRTTEGERVITVTYRVILRAALKCRIGKPSIPMGEEITWERLAVWKKYKGKWKLVADGLINLTPGSAPPFPYDAGCYGDEG